ncbi:unnamed protein product [Phytomonas sp. EM1]|nr:unnamed protein product [Phytomonas sp. EM1]|eukprot:CCW62899.1 unnamed protein product [Phytomonas sp. isolate EM1]
MVVAKAMDCALSSPKDGRPQESGSVAIRKFFILNSSSDDEEIVIKNSRVNYDSDRSSEHDVDLTLLSKHPTSSSSRSSSSDGAAGDTELTRLPPHQGPGASVQIKKIPTTDSEDSSLSSVNILPESEDETQGGENDTPQADDATVSQPQQSKEGDREKVQLSPAALVNRGSHLVQPPESVTTTNNTSFSHHNYHLTPQQTLDAQVRGKLERADRLSIYERGINMKKRKEQGLQHLRAALLEDESKEATFHPKISKRAESLRRRSTTPEDATNAMRMKKRLMLLELPSNESNYSFTPRISRKSAEIVRHARSDSSMSLPIVERLYHGHGLSKKESRCALLDDTPRPKHIVRTPSEINKHIASMYLFESQRQEAIREVQEELLRGAAPTPHVDPSEVVKRLTSPNPLRRPSAYKAGTHSSPEECTFAPKLSTAASAYVARARQRGLTRWFLYFSKPNATTLSLEDLRHPHAQHADIASRIEAALIANSGRAATAVGEGKEEEEAIKPSPSVVASEWTLQEFLDALTAMEENKGLPQFWRESPSGDHEESAALSGRGRAKTTDSDLTFQPQINSKSRALAQRQCREKRAAQLPAHERLFLSVRQQQLQQAQKELEEEQERLVSEQLAEEKRARSILQWRQHNASRAKESKPEVAPPPADSQRAEATQHASSELEPAPKPPPPAFPAPKRDATPAAAAPVPKSSMLDLSVIKKATAELEEALREENCNAIKKNIRAVEGLSSATNPSAPTPPASRSDRKTRSHTPTRSSLGILFDHESPRTISLLLECAKCKNPTCVSTAERQKIERDNKRRLRQLGRALYRKSCGLCP